MAGPKIKICPSCGAKNPASYMECMACEADLTGVKPMDEDRQREEQAEPMRAPTGMVRICSECGAENPPQARKCVECGEDISDILPSPAAETAVRHEQAKQAQRFCLTSVDGALCFAITEDDMVLGRTAGLAEYLAAKPYVSRQHARLMRHDGKLYVENLSQTNHTFLNNEDIGTGHAVELHVGDELGLGGKLHHGSRQEQAAYFVLRIDE